MNYLAHLALSGNDSAVMAGNLMGDFVKGDLTTFPHPAIKLGLKLHRKIDHFTDHHPLVLEAKQLTSSNRRRYAGIILDLSFDHFLARHWMTIYNEELLNFTLRAYRQLHLFETFFPPRLQRVFPIMEENNWLLTYRSREGIADTIERMAQYRLKQQPNPLYGAIDELLNNYQDWEQTFLLFYPELQRFAEQWLKQQETIRQGPRQSL